MATPEVQQEIYDRGDGGRPKGLETLHNRRIQIVKQEFANAIPTITVNKCEGFMRHTYHDIFDRTIFLIELNIETC